MEDKYQKAIEEVQKLLYWDYRENKWDHDKDWIGYDELVEIHNILLKLGLVPQEKPVKK